MIEINKIYCEDNLITMGKIPDNSIDLTITSPPYNCGIDYDIYNDNREWDEYLYWCKKWLKELYRITKDDGRICINVLTEAILMNNTRERISPFVEFYKLIKNVGFKHAGLPMWTDRSRSTFTAWGSWMNASAPFIYNPFEVIIIAYKNTWKKQNKGISTMSKKEFITGCSGVWNIRTQTTQITKANFHKDLPKLCIGLLSFEGDLIYDPFMGSGTVGCVCVLEKRNYIGSEISPKYCKIAEKRIEEHKKRPKPFFTDRELSDTNERDEL